MPTLVEVQVDLFSDTSSTLVSSTTSEQVTLVPFFCQKNGHLLHCSSFFVKRHARLTCSFVNALTTVRCRYHLFTISCLRHDFIYIALLYHVGANYAAIKMTTYKVVIFYINILSKSLFCNIKCLFYPLIFV